MSDLQPEGFQVEFDGVQRRLIWDYGVIEKVQEKYGGHPFSVVRSIFRESNVDGTVIGYYQAGPIIDLMFFLLNNEVARQKYFDGKSDLKLYTREQVGFLINRKNAGDIANAIVASWTGSNPQADPDDEEDEEDEEGDSKNVQSGKH